jgi:hypothetical protein
VGEVVFLDHLMYHIIPYGEYKMHRQELIQKTVNYLDALSDDKIIEITDFVEFLYQKHEENILREGIQQLCSRSGSFKFLEDEEDLYTLDDIKETY